MVLLGTEAEAAVFGGGLNGNEMRDCRCVCPSIVVQEKDADSTHNTGESGEYGRINYYRHHRCIWPKLEMVVVVSVVYGGEKNMG